jgi:hypothetical protein
MSEQPRRRALGITVLGDFILSEGVDAVIENLLHVGATAVACNPTVTAAAPEGKGSFQPPLDAGSSPRVFDRPLFGKTALWLQSGPSYQPHAELYRDSPYGPRQTNALTEQHGRLIGEFIERANAAGLRVYFQIGAAQPSGLRDEDRPRLPNGQLPQVRVADTASLASSAVRAYNRAYLQDLLQEYPSISGIRIDWPESPCYTIEELFQDFSEHALAWGRSQGFDVDAAVEDVGRLYAHRHGSLSNGQLLSLAGSDRGRFAVWTWLQRYPGVYEWLRLKAALSTDIVRDWRATLDDVGGPDYELIAHAFMPPFSAFTGLDFAAASQHCNGIAPKLYTMHWSQMVEFWGRRLLEHNARLEESCVVRSLASLFDIAAPDAEGISLADYGYPAPDEPHPIDDAPQARKIRQVISATHLGTVVPVVPLVHGYGPVEDFARRLQLVVDSDADGVWINRYGYLSDEKLEVIGKLARTSRELE